uniref:Bicaudal C homolog 2 n=1 Tax=Cyprinus carpio carpio TaxID=630221 RepID=A0A9J8C0Q6_CYPCA
MTFVWIILDGLLLVQDGLHSQLLQKVLYCQDEGESNPRKLAQIMQNLGVFISVKPKVKQTAKSVVVKGLERNISSQYEARCLLLGLDSTEV